MMIDELTDGRGVLGAALVAERPGDGALLDEALLQLVVVEERVQVEHRVRGHILRLCKHNRGR